MGIAEDVEARKAAASGPKVKICKFAELLIALPTTERDALLYAVEQARLEESLPQPDRFFTKQFVYETCINNGHDIGKTVVSEHLRKVCACDD